MEPKEDPDLNLKEHTKILPLREDLLLLAAQFYAAPHRHPIEGLLMELSDIERCVARLRVLLEDAKLRAERDERRALLQAMPRIKKVKVA